MSASLKKFGVFFDRYYWQAAVMIARNGLARQYRNSFLGMLWTLLQPLTMVFVYVIMMPMVMKMSAPNYKLYVVVSFPVWGFMSVCLVHASYSLISNAEVLKRCMISSTVFPVADVLRHAYTFIISFVIMNGVALLVFAPLDPLLLLLPVFFIPMLMIMGATTIAIAFLAPYVRDIGDLILVCLNMMFWLTPVVYQVSALPPFAQALMQWNPFFIMLRPIQMLAYQHVMPGIHEISCLLGLTLVAITVGFCIFKVCRRNYVYYL